MQELDQMCSKIAKAADIHSVIAITDAHGRIVYVNRNFEELSGYSNKELIGKTHQIINSGFHSKAFFAHLWKHIKTGKTWRGQLCNRDKSGGLYWVDTTIFPIFGVNGTIEQFVSIRTDISKVVFDRNQQRQFRENAEVLNQLSELNIPEFSLNKVLEKAFALVLDLRWLRTRNKGGIFLLDASSECYNHVASCNLDKVEQDYWAKKLQTLEQSNGLEQVAQNQSADSGDQGESFHIPIRGSGGIIGALVLYLEERVAQEAHHESFLYNFCHTLGLVVENRQQRKHMQVSYVEAVRMQQIADVARCEAEHAAEVKSRFLASMSHEIRTPMNGVLGMLSLLESGHLTDDQKELVDIASSSAKSLMTIINDILDFSKYESDGFSLEYQPIQIVEQCQQIIRPLQEAAKAKFLELELNFADDLPDMILGDITRLGQVITNLVSNAIKFTETGTVHFSMTTETSSEGDLLVVAVSDTGIGMEESAQSTIFDRFSQADTSISRQFGGTGLGLAIVRQLAEAMGGAVVVQSQLGQGSEFRFSIPLLEAQAKVDIAERGQDKLPSRSLNVLVAEDNPANQFLMEKLLETTQHKVTLVENGRQAVNAVQNNDFDVVLMDVQMPVLDGLAASRQIRAIKGVKGQIPIIAVTADVMPQQVTKIISSGANFHVGKPIDPAELFQALASISNLSDPEPLLQTGT